MSDVTVRLEEGGEVTVEGLDGLSYSHVVITKERTTFSIKTHTLRVGYHDLELLSGGKVIYSESWK